MSPCAVIANQGRVKSSGDGSGIAGFRLLRGHTRDLPGLEGGVRPAGFSSVQCGRVKAAGQQVLINLARSRGWPLPAPPLDVTPAEAHEDIAPTPEHIGGPAPIRPAARERRRATGLARETGALVGRVGSGLAPCSIAAPEAASTRAADS